MTVGGEVRRERPGRVLIMRASIMEMGEQGYEGASMRDMAARAGVSVAALYYHFPSKRELLGEFLDEAYDVIERRLDRRVDVQSADPAARLDQLVATLIASYTHDEFAVRASLVALREYIRVDEERRRSVDRKRERIVDRAREIVAEGAALGVFSTDDVEVATRAVVAMCATTVEAAIEGRTPLAVVIDRHQRLARSMVDTRFHVEREPILGTGFRPDLGNGASVPSTA